MTTSAPRWRARRRVLVAAAAALALATTAVLTAVLPASAAGPGAGAPGQRGGASASAGGDGVDVEGSRGADGSGSGGGSASSGGGPGAGGPAGPVRVVNYVLMCAGNTPAAPADVALCAGAAGQCPPPELHYWRFVSTGGGPFVQDGARCLTPAQAAAGDEFPGFDVDDLRRLPLPPGVVTLEPGNGYALVGVPVNAVAAAAALVLPAPVAGFDVQVRATPASYTWDFGDGTSLTTTDPGAPYPALDVTHTYTAGGALQVTLTTAYTGEFSVDGGAFTPIEGTAVVASPPVPLALLTGRGGLVARAVG